MYEWTSLAMGNELGMKCITNKGNLDNPGAYVGIYIVINKKGVFKKTECLFNKTVLEFGWMKELHRA